MNAVDTNILIYARDPRDLDKQTIARALLDSLSDGVLLWQVACEYLAASRKLVPIGFDIQQAWSDLQDLRSAWITILPVWEVQDIAQELMKKYSLSIWDAMLIAACLEGGVACLYSEDFTGYSHVERLQLINPFATP